MKSEIADSFSNLHFLLDKSNCVCYNHIQMREKKFDWDEGNTGKNWEKHRVSDQECEEVFFDPWLIVHYDKGHSIEEDRYYVLGKTLAGRRLFIVFTTRDDKIRVISARDMSKMVVSNRI